MNRCYIKHHYSKLSFSSYVRMSKVLNLSQQQLHCGLSSECAICSPSNGTSCRSFKLVGPRVEPSDRPDRAGQRRRRRRRLRRRRGPDVRQDRQDDPKSRTEEAVSVRLFFWSSAAEICEIIIGRIVLMAYNPQRVLQLGGAAVHHFKIRKNRTAMAAVVAQRLE